MGNINRRKFLACTAGLVPFARIFAMTKEAPVMRLGVMSDTHVGKTVESCGRLRMALELFKAKGAELIINNGDIADHFYPTGYQAYRQVAEEVYGSNYAPQEIFAYAWHDAFDYHQHTRDQVVSDAPIAFEEVRRLLKAPNGHTAEVRFKGYTFLVMPQFTGSKGFLSWDEYEAKVASACRANPGKPVFVVDHVPPEGTVYNSYNWGSSSLRKVLDKYPQVVDFSGHVHGSLRNDLLIWQKEFTVINSGCLQKWDGLLSGNEPANKQAFGVLTVDVYSDRLLVRRWDVRDRSEIDPEHPWVVPLPFAAETAPYVRARRAATEPKPRFSPSARLSVVPEGRPFAGFRLSFPEVGAHTMLYRIAAQRKDGNGDWATFTWLETYSDYWMYPKDRTGRAEFLFRPEYFNPDTEYRFMVAPVNQYGVSGRPICAEAKSPAVFAKKETLYVSEHPMQELVFCRSRGSNRHVVADDGFYGPISGGQWLKLPEGLFKGPKGTKFLATIDMRTVQPAEGSQWGISFYDPIRSTCVSGRMLTPPGDSSDERYVLEFVKRNDLDTCYIQFDWGTDGRVKFNRLKIERV